MEHEDMCVALNTKHASRTIKRSTTLHVVGDVSR